MITQIEEHILGEDRIVTVTYDLPSNQWEPVTIKAVELYRQVFWNKDGTPGQTKYVVDLLPVLNMWQLQHIEDRVLRVLGAEAEADRLAA